MTAQQTAPAPTGLRAWSAAQRFAAGFGLIYLLVGAAGFVVTGFHDFAGMHHETLLIFAVNPLHNVIHMLLGLAWLGAAPHHRYARLVNLGAGVDALTVLPCGALNRM